MRRGVFALTLFLLLSTALVNLYAAYLSLVRASLSYQGQMMDADESFYLARNFEFDARRMIATGGNLSHWRSKGNLSFGSAYDSCVQTGLSWDEFRNRTFRGGHFLALGFAPACVTLEVDYKNFKTLGVLKSPLCINTSSRLLSCSP